MKVDERINKLERDIAIYLLEAEEISFTRYYPYLKQAYDELKVLKKAKKIRLKLMEIGDEDL